MITAFGEAFNNVVIHGYRGPRRRDARRRGGDQRRCDDPALDAITARASTSRSVPQPDLDSLPESGMGIFMIHALVDEVAYERGSPNVLSLTKRMPPNQPDLLPGPEHR